MFNLIEAKLTQQISIRGTQIGSDALMEPTWNTTTNAERLYGRGGKGGGNMRPIVHNINPEQLWSTAMAAPKGKFITWVMPKEAFKNMWKFVEFRETDLVLPDESDLRLRRLTREYKVRSIHTRAIQVSRTFGQSLVYKMPNRKKHRRRNNKDFYLRVHPIRWYEVIFEAGANEPSAYKINVRWGNQYNILTVPPEDAVFYVHDPDPNSNEYSGISELFSVYNNLKWFNNIEEGFAKGMSQRGISMIHFADPDFDVDRMNEYRSNWGNPAEYNVLFTDDEVEIKEIPGAIAGFDILNTSEAFAREVSAGTGVATSRIDGTQRGQVTGTSTDQDNYYSILNEIQESNNEYLLELYDMLLDYEGFDKLVGAFDIDYVTEPKLDKTAKAQIQSINASNAIQSYDVMTFNEIRTKFYELDTVEGGDVWARQYINEQNPDLMDDDGENGGGGEVGESDYTHPTNAKALSSLEKDPKKKGSSESNSKSPDKKGKDELKIEKLDYLKTAIDEDLSYREINLILKDRFGSGLSNSAIIKIKGKKIDS